MARVTVEDCLDKIPNVYEMIAVAAKRARQLAMTNTEPTVGRENDKATVIALREIAKGTVDAKILSESTEDKIKVAQSELANVESKK